jgi:hypothetical protein
VRPHRIVYVCAMLTCYTCACRLVPFSMRRAAAVSGRGAGRSSGMWGPMSMPGMQKPLPSAPSRNATPQEMARLASGGYGRIQSQGSRYLLNVSAPPAQPAAPKGPPGRGEQAVRGTVAPPPPLGAQARMRLLGSSAPLPPPRAVPPPAPAAIMMVETDLFGDDDAEALVRSSRLAFACLWRNIIRL